MKNQSCFKSFFTVLLLALSVSCALSGCHGPQYKDEEKEELEKQGEALMQTWLDAHLEDSKVLTAQADIYMYPSGPHYLTDFVAGTFTDDGNVRDYLINTKTNAVYLVSDAALLSEVCLDYAFEILGLEKFRDACRVSNPAAAMLLPDRGNSYADSEKNNQGTGMP